MLVASDEFVAYTGRSSAETKMPPTNWKDMAAFTVRLPPPKLAAPHPAIVGPMLEHVHSSIHESRKLAALRDYLLPRLLSGRVRVRDAARPAAGAV